MNKYPETIKDAAALLDKVNPNWHKRINPEILDMDNCRTCILGQLYTQYGDGIDALFGRDSRSVEKAHDMIFGRNSSNDEWKKEIESRFVMGFAEALQAIKDGHRVQIVSINKEVLYRKNHKLCAESNHRPYDIEDFFHLYEFKYKILPKQLTVADLKAGEKFTYVGQSEVMIKLEDSCLTYNAINDRFQLKIVPIQTAVTKVESK